MAAFSAYATNLVLPAPSGLFSNLYLSQTSIAIPAAGTPSTTSLKPANVAHGAPDFILAVIGTGFTTDIIAQWNGKDRVTTFLSPTKLFVRISPADVASGGNATVRTCTSGAGSGGAIFAIN